MDDTLAIADRFYDDKHNFDVLFDILSTEKSKRMKMKMKIVKTQTKSKTKLKTTNTRRKLTLKIIHFAVHTFSGSSVPRVCVYDGRPMTIRSIVAAGLARFGRRNYDVFCRTPGFVYTKHGKKIKTTLSQLLFFRDMIRYKIIDYIRENIKQIRAEMA